MRTEGSEMAKKTVMCLLTDADGTPLGSAMYIPHKIWDIRTKRLKHDLPGHKDDVYAMGWSPDGEKVASGGADKVLKLWKG